MKKINYLIVIVGPTAIGKTALSIRLANYFGCDIISCDSRQFYKEMTIGTAAPTPDELRQATHHFIHHKSIHEDFTVGDFERESLDLLDHLFLKNNIQIMVGGSGLYANAVLEGFDHFPEIDPEIRTQVRMKYELEGLSYLQQQLIQLDPNYYQKITSENPQTFLNPQRMMRFVEVCLSTQKPYSSFLNQKKNTRNFTPIVIGLNAQREQMYNRINQRVDLMMGSGLLKEVSELYPYKKLNALQTVGYKELFAYLDHEYTLDDAVSEIKKNTRRFAKRQLTWFKRNPNIHWFDFQTSPIQITETIQKLMK